MGSFVGRGLWYLPAHCSRGAAVSSPPGIRGEHGGLSIRTITSWACGVCHWSRSLSPLWLAPRRCRVAGFLCPDSPPLQALGARGISTIILAATSWGQLPTSPWWPNSSRLGTPFSPWPWGTPFSPWPCCPAAFPESPCLCSSQQPTLSHSH